MSSNPLDDGRIGEIMDALESALAVDMADFEFAIDGRVKRGRYALKPSNYFIAIANPDFEIVRGPSMQQYQQTASIDIVGNVPSNSNTPDGHARVALALANQMVEALETAAATPGNALRGFRDMGFTAVTLDPEVDKIPSGMAVAWLVLSITYKRPDQPAGL